ncbi:MAG: hypothetical protein OEZ34_09240 [Spirochaetia bacterium]|nr:hypothetical protein [Spirochaetia bacterium]
MKQKILWPSVHINHILPEERKIITEILLENIPTFITGCSILPEPRPRKDSNQIHYVRSYHENGSDYIYIFKVSCEYMGGADSSEIKIEGRQGIAPSFKTNRIYFSSLLIPVSEIARDNKGYINNFTPVQIKDAIFKVSSDDVIRDFRSTVLFDEIDFSEVNNKITVHFEFNSSWKHNKLFYPFVIDYLSLCMNLIHPDKNAVDLYAGIFDRCFMNFMSGEDSGTMSAEDKNFLKRYYNDWYFERIFSRSGNPHWLVKKVPDFF